MRKRDKLFSKAHASRNSTDWKAFRAYRNYVTKTVRNAHHDYVNGMVGKNLTSNPKSFWSYVKLKRTETLMFQHLKQQAKCAAQILKKLKP